MESEIVELLALIHRDLKFIFIALMSIDVAIIIGLMISSIER